MSTQTKQDNGDMAIEIDFSYADRGRLYRRNQNLHTPVFLDREVQEYLTGIAVRKGMRVSELANNLLKREIQIIETVM